MKAAKSIGIYILRGITLLIAVAIISFILAQVSPVDPVRQYIQANPGVSEENIEAMKEYWGLNDPPVERFVKWFSAVLHGDWGYSTTFRQPVLQVIGIRFRTSLALMITAWLFSGILGFVIGCVMALFRERALDRIIKRICLIMCSIPTFWIGLMFLAVFSSMLGWFPFGLAVPAGVPAEAVTLGISIHLNSFPQDEKVYGAQVFYPKARAEGTDVSRACEQSKRYAEAIQKSLETNIFDGRAREAMPKDDILLFRSIRRPRVLVECGFLSNHVECERLKTAEYQRQAARAIWEGVNEILCLEKNKSVTVIDSANKA